MYVCIYVYISDLIYQKGLICSSAATCLFYVLKCICSRNLKDTLRYDYYYMHCNVARTCICVLYMFELGWPSDVGTWGKSFKTWFSHFFVRKTS